MKKSLTLPFLLIFTLSSCIGGKSVVGDTPDPDPLIDPGTHPGNQVGNGVDGDGDGGETPVVITYHTLTLDALNGTVTAEPDLAEYEAGSSVILTATPEEGFEFVKWVGDEWAGQNPVTVVMDEDKKITARFATYDAAGTTYYVDYDSGSDENPGTAIDAPLKHAPGDSKYAGKIKLQPGNKVVFKGDVIYRGQIKIPADGTKSHPITYQGDAWPGLEGKRAVIDGGELVTGWTQCASAEECGGNAEFANLWYAYLPADTDPLALNLHEYDLEGVPTDAFLWPSQEPNPPDPYFFDNITYFREVSIVPIPNLTRESLVDSEVFNQADPNYWNDSYLLVWINPNTVVTRKILTYEPAQNQVTFENLGANAIYADGKTHQKYALFNSPRALDLAGEYCASTTLDGQVKIILWPRNPVDLDGRITYSVRTWGIDISERSNVAIEGFKAIKHSGTVIGSVTNKHINKFNLVIRNNLITHNRGEGVGIFLGHPYDTLVENNEVIDNPKQAGIFLGGEGARNSVRGNTVVRSGATSLRFYQIANSVLEGNEVRESKGSHGNGITLYMASHDILVANNRILDSNNPITIQDSGNLWFINNLVDGGEQAGSVNEWSNTGRGPWAYGTVAFLNNSFVRSALNFGKSTQNSYVSKNNILHGSLVDETKFNLQRSHNIYTAVFGKQTAQHGWIPAEGEMVMTAADDLSQIFVDPAGDYHLNSVSPAIAAGTNISPFLPPQEMFPEFDFTRDIDGTARTGWDIGAYDY